MTTQAERHKLKKRLRRNFLIGASIILFNRMIGSAAAVDNPKAPKAKSKPSTVKKKPWNDYLGGRLMVAPFENSAFPYDGPMPDASTTFLNVAGERGRRGHDSPRGGIYWLDRTYSDKRVALFSPRSFDPKKPAAIVLFFHGNQAILQRDVVERQGVMRQFAASGLNAVLIAPQLAVDALDSSAGHFWDHGFLDQFLREACEKLAILTDQSASAFTSLPVIIVAYSGGYVPAAASLHESNQEHKIRGVILLDAAYGDIERYAQWINAQRDHAFFISAYSSSSQSGNAQLRDLIGFSNGSSKIKVPATIKPGTISFISAPGANHLDFVTQAWTENPLQVILSRIEEFKPAPPPPPKKTSKKAPAKNSSFLKQF